MPAVLSRMLRPKLFPFNVGCSWNMYRCFLFDAESIIHFSSKISLVETWVGEWSGRVMPILPRESSITFRMDRRSDPGLISESTERGKTNPKPSNCVKRVAHSALETPKVGAGCKSRSRMSSDSS